MAKKTDDDNVVDDGTILRFLAQIYSPADTETGNEFAFHRSFYVFACPHPICSSAEMSHKSVVVLRGQMARKNEFYPYEDDEDNIDDWKLHESNAWEVNLCTVCGQVGRGKCPLSNLWFCGKEHQRDYHKLKRSQNDDLKVSSLIYTESELVVEEEPMEEKKSDDDEKKSASALNKESMFADTDDVDDDGENDADLEQEDLNEMTGIDALGGTSDPVTMEFYTRIGRANGDVKGQCLRYNRWPVVEDIDDNDDAQNGPLWISSAHCPTSDEDIPNCQYCGAARKFEFQLMPQIIHQLIKDFNVGNDSNTSNDNDASEENQRLLLAASDLIDKAKEDGKENDLPEEFETTQKELVEKLKQHVLSSVGDKDDNIDFGTISVYTCTNSCGDGRIQNGDDSLGAYRQEFAWRQPPLQ